MVDTSVSRYYDDFSAFQKKIAYNERHYLMLDKLIGLGLSSRSNVLELGCGIGVISTLMLRVVKEGSLTAVDISPRSIEIARTRNPRRNVTFEIGDITTYVPRGSSYDFVTLFDVLEHVPVEAHASLFSRIASAVHETTKVVVNIPTPEYLEYLHKTHPENLQIIDQPLSVARLLLDSERNGLVLRCFERYDLWRRNESIFMWFEKRTPFIEVETDPPSQTLLRRLQNKLQIYW